MAIFYVNRTCKQTVREEWDEVVFVEAETEGEAREKVENNSGTLNWQDEEGMRSFDYEVLGPAQITDIFFCEVEEPWDVRLFPEKPRTRREEAMRGFENLQGLKQ